MNRFTYIFGFLLTASTLSAQVPKFGDISENDLKMTEYSKDKEVAAIYLLDWCEAKINAESNLPLTVKKHFRIKILKPQGLEYASKKLISSTNRIPGLKASTFNLEDGKIIESVLTKKDIYSQKRSSETYSISFAFTNVKVGSIIECSYTMSYETIFQLYPWEFQHDIPVVYSEYTAIYPGFFQYKYELHAYDLAIEQKRTERDFTTANLRTKEISLQYSGHDLPAFEPELYMSSESDELARVEFELGSINLPNYGKHVTPTYSELSEELLKDENFGGSLEKTGFLTKIVAKITKGLTKDIDKIKAIRSYITENVKWNEEEGIFTTYPRFRKTLNRQNGSVADINLLFVAMLRKADFSAYPVVLSTRENGKLNPFYSIVTKFNYVLAYVRLNDKDYLMDATDADRPFDELPFGCLNGQGRIIREKADGWIPLKNKERLYDQVLLNVTIGTDESLIGNVQRIYSGYSAYAQRKIIKAIGTEGFLEMLKQTHGNWEYSDLKIENIEDIDQMLVLKYNLKANDVVQKINDLSIINPVLFFAHNQNPYPKIIRKYPIDFGCAEDELYTLKFEIPAGYCLDEHPEKFGLKLPDNAAVFSYLADQKDKIISIMYRYNRKQSNFEPEQYLSLREFSNQMITKQSELIILKKIDAPIVENEINLKSQQ